MSVTLHPGIGGLDTQGLCYSLYRQLYQTFFNAQERKSEDNPYGVEEGDDTSIRLHNTAYGFAEAISSGVSGEGGGTGSWSAICPKAAVTCRDCYVPTTALPPVSTTAVCWKRTAPRKAMTRETSSVTPTASV